MIRLERWRRSMDRLARHYARSGVDHKTRAVDGLLAAVSCSDVRSVRRCRRAVLIVRSATAPGAFPRGSLEIDPELVRRARVALRLGWTS